MLSACIVDIVFDKVDVLVGIVVLTDEIIVLVIGLVIDCCVLIELFVVDKLCELIWAVLIGVVLTVVTAEDAVSIGVLLVVPKVFVDDDDGLDTMLDVDDDE